MGNVLNRHQRDSLKEQLRQTQDMEEIKRVARLKAVPYEYVKRLKNSLRAR